MGADNVPHVGDRGEESEKQRGSGTDTAAATDREQQEHRRAGHDTIDETVEALFENRSTVGSGPTPDEIQNALSDETTSVEARIKLREAFREIDLDERETIEADIRAVMTAQEILEEDVRDLLGRVRRLERTLDRQESSESEHPRGDEDR